MPLLKSDIVDLAEPLLEAFVDTTSYRAAFGGLHFLQNRTRPDIAVAVGLLGRRSINPSVQA